MLQIKTFRNLCRGRHPPSLITLCQLNVFLLADVFRGWMSQHFFGQWQFDNKILSIFQLPFRYFFNGLQEGSQRFSYLLLLLSGRILFVRLVTRALIPMFRWTLHHNQPGSSHVNRVCQVLIEIW